MTPGPFFYWGNDAGCLSDVVLLDQHPVALKVARCKFLVEETWNSSFWEGFLTRLLQSRISETQRWQPNLSVPPAQRVGRAQPRAEAAGPMPWVERR